MEVGVQQSDPIQRIQPNGPRVSFNRDVHVKRIGNRLNETENYPVQTTNLQPPQNSKPPLRRELPADLSQESILKEAALVLAQAEGIRCKAEGGNDIVGGRLNEKPRGRVQRRDPPIPNKFHSLPTRKNKAAKPVSRSVSDASSKKAKKPSIFSIFSRKSEPNLDQLSSLDSKSSSKDSSIGKRVTRSKSDAGTSKERPKIVRKRNLSENEDSNVNVSKSTQLSPIIENTLREDYFAEEDSKDQPDSKADANKENSKELINKSSTPEVKPKPKSKSPDKTEARKKKLVEEKRFGSLPRPQKSGLKKTEQLFSVQSKSLEDMHCSQLPPEKPPLTKGLTVDGLVKRLSMERFSPPPHLSTPGFSYIRPTNEQQVIYAQVVCDNNESKAKQTVHVDPPKDMEFHAENSRFTQNGSRFNNRSTIERSHFPSHNKSEFHVNETRHETRHRSYSPQIPTKVRETNSPQHWKQSPRNLSDEDEGLGFEPRKYFEEEIPEPSIKVHREYEYGRKSPSDEPPIIPVIRSHSPIDVHLSVADRGRADGMDSKRREHFSEVHNDFNDLSYRRAALESKIRNRRFGSVEPDTRRTPDREYRYSPERNDFQNSPKYYREERTERYLSPARDNLPKYHKLNTHEVFNKYSPERTHLDMISPVKEVKSSRYIQTRTFDDGHGGIREVYEKETTLDEHGKPHVKETRRRERLDSPRRTLEPEMVTCERDQFDERYRHEHEPKSFDSQFSETNRSSPENQKYFKKHEETWQNSLKRDKRHQRSFDKGDSGIENDFRKESFNGELMSKWRKRTVDDDIRTCELFLKKERRHTEELYHKRYDFVYRERSIDDGSHFDPRLDKYPKETLRKKKETDRYSSPNRELTGTLKREKKKGGLEKVKQLFTSSSKKKETKEVKEAKETNGKVVEPLKNRYLVREEEMRQRYHEYNPHQDPMIPDIATRRRLSTPKASPLLKRTSSEKTPKTSPLALRDDSTMTKAEKSGWFKSIDRRSKKKASPKLDSPTRTPVTTTTEDEFSTLRVKKSYRTPVAPPAPPVPEKSLRFFGDTDLESNPSFSRAASAPRARPSVIALSRHQKHSQSAYHLDRITKPVVSKSQPRSSSLQNLGEGIDEVDRSRRRQHSRSRELDDISESASDSEMPKHPPNSRHASTSRLSSARDVREMRDVEPIAQQKRYYEEHTHRSSRDRENREPRERRSPSHRRDSTDPARIEFRKPPPAPPGPPKPARSADRRTTYSRERERLHDSSGTEGESSLQSQRSVVYLHATTVGAIPQPYHLSTRRRAMSREELSALKKKEKMQPMTRTVSRSVSMLAPWKPKHLHEGYEINYSQEPTDKSRKTSTMPRNPATNHSNSKSKKTISNSSTLQRSKKSGSSRDDISSTRPSSSLTSASKSGISSDKKSSSDLRKDTLSRRKVK